MAISEVEFLRAVVALSGHEDLSSMADAALAASMDRSGAHHGYLELDEEGDPRDVPWFGHSRHCSPEHVEFIRDRVSKGILFEARIDRRTIMTPSALRDPRFKDLESVREHEIGAVLCVPFDGFWGVGVLYLQAAGGAEFSREARASAEIVAGQVKLLLDATPSYLDAYEDVATEMDARKRLLVADALRASELNVAAVARKLKISPRYIRGLLRQRRKP